MAKGQLMGADEDQMQLFLFLLYFEFDLDIFIDAVCEPFSQERWIVRFDGKKINILFSNLSFREILGDASSLFPNYARLEVPSPVESDSLPVQSAPSAPSKPNSNLSKSKQKHNS